MAAATIVIDGKVGDVFPLFSNVAKIADVHPSVKSVDVVSKEGPGKVTGVGAARRCNFYDGGSIVETVTACTANSKVHLVGSEYAMPLSSLELEFTVLPVGADKTQATWYVDILCFACESIPQP